MSYGQDGSDFHIVVPMMAAFPVKEDGMARTDKPEGRQIKNAVVDARCDGLSASRVWRELGLLRLNAELAADLTPREVAWNRAEIDETDPSKVLSIVEVRFPTRERGSPPSSVILRVRNAGILPLDFALRFPRDDEDEPETWVRAKAAISSLQAG